MVTSDSSDDRVFRSLHGMWADWLRSPHEGSHIPGDTRGGGQQDRPTELGCEHLEMLHF